MVWYFFIAYPFRTALGAVFQCPIRMRLPLHSHAIVVSARHCAARHACLASNWSISRMPGSVFAPGFFLFPSRRCEQSAARMTTCPLYSIRGFARHGDIRGEIFHSGTLLSSQLFIRSIYYPIGSVCWDFSSKNFMNYNTRNRPQFRYGHLSNFRMFLKNCFNLIRKSPVFFSSLLQQSQKRHDEP
jgi:hypothetical protein